MKGGIDGEFEGRVYPLAIGIKEGPRKLMLFGKGSSYNFRDGFLVASEANEDETLGYGTRIPMDNVAFVASPFFLIDTPPK